MKSSGNKEKRVDSDKNFSQEEICPHCGNSRRIIDHGVRPCPYCASDDGDG